MSNKDPIVIVGAARTPMGGFLGDLKNVTAPHLGTIAIKGALEHSGVSPDDVEDVLMGVVLPAGIGQAPARQASRGANIPDHAGSTTINKMCGSGMKAAMLAHDCLFAGSASIIVAGGMESMSNTPYLLTKARSGYRLGHGEKIQDHMFLDGLEDAYDQGKLMGCYAEDTAKRYQFTREEQDDFAIESLSRAKKAIENNTFKKEVWPVKVQNRKSEVIIDRDEQPLKANIEKIRTLKPAFAKEGTVTPANSSSISDGAAALVLMRLSEAEKRGLTPIAKISGHTSYAQEPAWFTTAPIGAVKKLLDKIGWSSNDVDLYEINEAFAVVTMAAIRELSLNSDIVNIHGGACALGHPVGASGARIIVTLLTALNKYNLKKGVAALCIGGGEATAIAVEMFN
jgi:acetyl-CoA C-acetyltransferase